MMYAWKLYCACFLSLVIACCNVWIVLVLCMSRVYVGILYWCNCCCVCVYLLLVVGCHPYLYGSFLLHLSCVICAL